MMLILVGLLPTTANAGSVVNECKTGAECVDLGFKYVTGNDVKQDQHIQHPFYIHLPPILHWQWLAINLLVSTSFSALN